MINYYLITKPGILLGNLVTLAGGFLLATQGKTDYLLFLETLLGLGLIMASGCVFNNYIDRTIDKKMERTKNRPLVLGLISARNAIIFGICLGILGAFFLLIFTNWTTVAVAALGFFVYVVLYSLWKGSTVYGTAIGSIAGAVPPVVGYCAVSHRFDLGAVILFTLMVLWQMPHFFAIALLHLEDYTAAKIPVLPVQKGILRTKWHMLVYILGFITAVALLTTFGYTGDCFFWISMTLGSIWLALCLTGFRAGDDRLWAKSMFRFSLILIVAICTAIPLEKTLF